MQENTLILIQCKDAVGLVSIVANIVAKHRLNIITMREFVDQEQQKFFLRVTCSGSPENAQNLLADLQAALPENAYIRLNPPHRKRVVILVTKEHHCLGDILVRHYFGTLPADVVGVIGNYDHLRRFTERFDLPYYYISHAEKTKHTFEEELVQQIDALQPDFIVLAKFMRILSPEFVARYKYKIINIHHSFLPAFVGANPYKQAHDRGVKIIGATAHYVTDDLDEGPIITQNIKTIDHTYDIQRMKNAGQEVEKAVLIRAIQLVMEDRVMINGNKTIVFKA